MSNSPSTWQVIKSQPAWCWLLTLLAVAIAFGPYRFLDMPTEHSIEAASVSRVPTGLASPVSLPHNWVESAPRSIEVWYQLPAGSIEGETAGLYIPFVVQNAALWVNGRVIADGGSMTPPVARNWNRPLFFEVNTNLLNGSQVQLQVRAAEVGTGYLGQVFLGPRHELKPFFERHLMWRVNAEQVVTIALVLFGFFTFLMWLMRRSEREYLWFSLTAFLWGVHELNLYLVELPFSDRVWEMLVIVSLGWSILCMLTFTFVCIGQHFSTRINRLIAAYAFIGPLPLLFLDLQGIRFYGYLCWLALLIPMGAFMIWQMWKAHAIHREPMAPVLATAGMVLVVLAAHDLLLANLVWTREDAHLLQFGAIATIATLSVLLILRFVNALNQSEQLSRELEARVKAKEQQLDAHYQRVADLEREQVLASERDRIMRDIHDGVGGQLVAVKTLLEQPTENSDLQDAIEDALEDLRLVIDSLDSEADDLTTALGMLRTRLQHKLASIKLNWRVDDVPPVEGFGPEKALQVMRIVQEALTNAIKHSQADEITLSVGTEMRNGHDHVRVSVTDNGVGFSPDKQGSSHRGLRNQQYRAKSIGADLEIGNAPQAEDRHSGTEVTLWLACA